MINARVFVANVHDTEPLPGFANEAAGSKWRTYRMFPVLEGDNPAPAPFGNLSLLIYNPSPADDPEYPANEIYELTLKRVPKPPLEGTEEIEPVSMTPTAEEDTEGQGA